MENVINKLDKLTDKLTDKINPFNSWSSDEIKQLLNIYFIISKKETHIFELIYSYHDCDSWEDIFRDYNIEYLEDKSNGVKIAIEKIEKTI